jgi:predicted ATPase/DNA-binding SARP family transcriptional activator
LQEYLHSVHLLGKFELIGPSGPVRLRSVKTRQLLALLALQIGQSLRKAALAEALWPDVDEDKQSQSLRQCLSSITKGCGTQVLASSRGYVELRSSAVVIDVSQFYDRLAEVRTAAEAERKKVLRKAIDFVRGPLLSDLDHEWILPEQLRLEEAYANAVCQLVEFELAGPNPREAVDLGRRALTLFPLREDIHVALVRAYGVLGMTSEAIRQFETLEAILEDNWGEPPSEAARQALNELPSITLPKPKPEGGTPKLVGREEELESLRRACDEHTGGLWTLLGAGGAGKTKLATCLAEERRGIFVDLSDLRDSDLVKFRAYSLVTSDPSMDTERFVQSLNGRPLILDNAEHLIEGVRKLVQELTAASSAVTIFVTSREALELESEHVLEVGPLKLPETDLPLGELRENPCVSIFVRRACALRNSFAIVPDNARAIAEICRRLDGMPLAIELAASQTVLFTPAEILSRLEQGSLRWDTPSQRHNERHRSIEKSFLWSYELLTITQRESLCRLAIFRGSFSIEMAEALLDDLDALPTITRLVQCSLLRRVGDSGRSRFAMLVPIRVMALHYLKERFDEAMTRDKMMEICLSTANSVFHRVNGSDPKCAIEEVEEDFEVYRMVFESTGTNSKRLLQSLFMLSALGVVLVARRLGVEMYSAAFERWRRLKDQIHACEYAIAGYGVACLAALRRDPKTMAAILDECLESGQDLHPADRGGLASARMLANIISTPGTFPEGEEEMLISMAERILGELEGRHDSGFWHSDSVRLILMGNVASTLRRIDRSQEAVEILAQAVSRPEASLYPRTLASMTLSLADNAMDIGDYALAERHFPRAIDLAEQTGQPYLAQQARRSTAMWAVIHGRYGVALRKYVANYHQWRATRRAGHEDVLNVVSEIAWLGVVLELIQEDELRDRMFGLAGALGLSEDEFWFGSEQKFATSIGAALQKRRPRQVSVEEVDEAFRLVTALPHYRAAAVMDE